MKVVLIRPNTYDYTNTRLPKKLNKSQGVLQPIGIMQMAAVLREEGIDVEIIDASLYNYSLKQLGDVLKDKNADIVGIGPVMTPNFRDCLWTADVAKKTGALVIFGGPQLSLFPKEVLSYKQVDFGFDGEADYSFPKLVKALRDGKDYRKIGGLIYKEEGKVFCNYPVIVSDINKLPMPAYDLVEMNKYSSIISLHPVVTMMTGRGCPFKCGFCYKLPSDKKYRFRNAVKVVDEIEYLIKKYRIREVMFYDDTLTLNKKNIELMCKEILKRKLRFAWESPTRVDTVDEELLKLMKKSGCKRLRFGVESGDPKILKIMRKQVSHNQVIKIFDICNKLKIETFAYFIIGYVYENKKTMMNTINFAKRIKADWYMFTVATPLPDTPLFEDSVKEGLINPDYWRDYVLLKPVKRIPLLVPNADKYVKKAYFQTYFRISFILRKLFKISSFDELIKLVKGALAILES